MSWSDVARVHRSLAGVYVQDGRIISILAAADSHYNNEVTHERIRYGISPKSGEDETVKAFDSAVRKGYAFRVFYKHSPGHWEDY
jgi:hypothetical protein